MVLAALGRVYVADIPQVIRDKGRLCPREVLCSNDWVSTLLLGVSATTAYAMYPALIMVFVSKMNFMRTWLATSQLTMWFDFHEMHSLHKRCGWYILWLAVAHGSCHVARLSKDGKLALVWDHVSGVTGWVGVACVLITVLPMGVDYLRSRIPFEIRKALHWVHAAVFGLGVAHHAPKTYIAPVMGASLALWLLDWAYVQVFATYRVDTAVFHRLENSVAVYFENPKGFQPNNGYIMMCVPFINRYEWHAFSLHKLKNTVDGGDASNVSCACIGSAKPGSWTARLHNEVEIKTSRPLWLQGSFLSPYATGINFDKLICVASGVGITPAINLVETIGNSRSVHLIWICRDASMIEFYLNRVRFDTDAWWLIFYTGKRKLMLSPNLSRKVMIIPERPVLREVVCSLIADDGSDEDYLHNLRELSDVCRTEQATVLSEVPAESMLRASQTHSAGCFVKSVIHCLLQGATEEEIVATFRGDGGELCDAELLRLMTHLAPDVDFSEGPMAKAVLSMFGADPRARRDGLVAMCEAVMEDSKQKPLSSRASQRLSLMQPMRVTTKIRSSIMTRSLANTLSRWQMMYCGGSDVIMNNLQAVSNEFGLQFRVEKFNW